MHVFLTGATGFIGSYVAKALLARGDSLTVFARNPGKVPSLCAHPQVKVIQGELQDLPLLRQGLRGCEACVHVALGWGDTPESMLRNDTLPTVALLEAAADAGCRQFLYTSSTAAMGEMRSPMHEDLRCLPIDLYGATKAASEAFVLGFRKTAMRCNVIRPGYTFGNPAFPDSTSQPDRRFRDIAACAIGQKPIHLTKHDGTQFVHAADLARLYLAVLDSDCVRETFLGLASEWVSWETVALTAIALCASKSVISLEDKGWGADPIVFDVARIRDRFGLDFKPEPCLTDHVRWCIDIEKGEKP